MTLTVPTLVTIMRIALALAIVVPFLVLDRPAADFWAAVLFAAASASDFLDGYLARRTGSATEFGAMLDSIADKVLIASAFIVIAAHSGIGAYVAPPFALILFREFLVSGLRERLAGGAQGLNVTYLAKWKTTAQMLASMLLICIGGFAAAGWSGFARAADGGPTWPDMAGIAMAWIACVLTLVSGFDYFAKAASILKGAPDDG